jgi:hypothetical protein
LNDQDKNIDNGVFGKKFITINSKKCNVEMAQVSTEDQITNTNVHHELKRLERNFKPDATIIVENIEK